MITAGAAIGLFIASCVLVCTIILMVHAVRAALDLMFGGNKPKRKPEQPSYRGNAASRFLAPIAPGVSPPPV